MKIIFCSMMFADADENIRKSKKPNTVSGHKYQENLLRGLLDNECEVTVINTPRIRKYPDYKKILIKADAFYLDKNVIGKNIGFINLFVINYITQYIHICRELEKTINKFKKEKVVLLVFNSYLIQSLAMLKVKRKYKNIILCDSIGDIHGKYGITVKRIGIKGKIITWIEELQDKIAVKFDAFVLHTKPMAEALHITNKPFCLMECPYKISFLKETIEDKEKDRKVIMYAGTLQEDYGLWHLIHAFLLICDDKYFLQIAGSGDMAEEIKQLSEKNDRIQYLGFISPAEVSEYQQRADILVNPRTSAYEFVKYSFPSKIMEYLASGTPYVGHRLPCIPSEYDLYIQYPKDESDEALMEKIVEICELSLEERKAIGEKARNFIIEEKNHKVMCKKIVHMLEGVKTSYEDEKHCIAK